MKWMTEVSSAVYATPLITDLFSDGHKEVIVPTFSNYLEVIVRRSTLNFIIGSRSCIDKFF